MEQEKQTKIEKTKRYCESGVRKDGNLCIAVQKYISAHGIVGTELKK